MAAGVAHFPTILFAAVTGTEMPPAAPPSSGGASSKPPVQQVPRLVCQIASDPPRTVTLPLDRRVLVGRTLPDGSGDPVDLDLSASRAAILGVSRRHAVIEFRNGELELEDLGSVNGTRINGLQIEPHTRQRLHSGDELELGRLRITVRLIYGGR